MPSPDDARHEAPPPDTLRARLPNALTAARVLLALVFFAVLWIGLADRPPGIRVDQRPAWLWIAAGLFAFAAITDALDGYLARRWNAVSAFGRIMDPFADKLLVLGAFVMLASPALADATDAGWAQASGVHAWMVALILARELFVTSARGYYEGLGVDFSAGIAGKLKMVLQSVCVPAVLILLATLGAKGGRLAIDLIVWGTLVVTLWSLVPYAIRAARAGAGPMQESMDTVQP